MKNFALAALLALLVPGFASATTLIGGGWSHHLDDNYDYQSSHKLVGVKRGGVVLVAFENSYHEDAFSVGYQFTRHVQKNWEGGLTVGLVYGYRNCRKGFGEQNQRRRVCPALSPSLTYTGWAEETGFSPAVNVLGSAVVLSVEIEPATTWRLLRQNFGK